MVNKSVIVRVVKSCSIMTSLVVVISGITMIEIDVTKFVVNDSWVLVKDWVIVKNCVIRNVVVGITIVVVADVIASPVLVTVGPTTTVVVIVVAVVKDKVSV